MPQVASHKPPPLHSFRGTPSECDACGEVFRGVTNFDLHRVGQIAYCYVHNPDDEDRKDHREDVDTLSCRWRQSSRRRCLQPSELLALGLEKDAKGCWTPKEGVPGGSRNPRFSKGMVSPISRGDDFQNHHGRSSNGRVVSGREVPVTATTRRYAFPSGDQAEAFLSDLATLEPLDTHAVFKPTATGQVDVLIVLGPIQVNEAEALAIVRDGKVLVEQAPTKAAPKPKTASAGAEASGPRPAPATSPKNDVGKKDRYNAAEWCTICEVPYLNAAKHLEKRHAGVKMPPASPALLAKQAKYVTAEWCPICHVPFLDVPRHLEKNHK